MARPETGPMMFGEDWPGVFIRGDNAAHYASVVARGKLDAQLVGDKYGEHALAGLEDLLRSCGCHEGIPGGTQALRDWTECERVEPAPAEEPLITTHDFAGEFEWGDNCQAFVATDLMAGKRCKEPRERHAR